MSEQSACKSTHCIVPAPSRYTISCSLSDILSSIDSVPPLSYGRSPGQFNNYGCTALISAVNNGNYELTDLLLTDGRCDPTIVDCHGYTAIKRAIACSAWKRRKAIVCARVLYWESLGYK